MILDKQETAAWNKRFVEAGIAVYGIRSGNEIAGRSIFRNDGK